MTTAPQLPVLDVTLRTGGRPALATGSIVSDSGEPVQFEFNGSLVEIRFTEAERAHPAYAVETLEANRLVLVLSGFSNAAGTAIGFDFGEHEGRPVQFRLVVHAVGERSDQLTRLVSYSILLAAQGAA